MFSYLLPMGRPEMNETMDYHSVHCLPFLAYLMLKLSLSLKREASMRWIYWSLAQVSYLFDVSISLVILTCSFFSFLETDEIQ